MGWGIGGFDYSRGQSSFIGEGDLYGFPGYCIPFGSPRRFHTLHELPRRSFVDELFSPDCDCEQRVEAHGGARHGLGHGLWRSDGLSDNGT